MILFSIFSFCDVNFHENPVNKPTKYHRRIFQTFGNLASILKNQNNGIGGQKEYNIM